MQFFVKIYVCVPIILFQIPQYLHEANWTGNGYVVGITQPRRVAATTVSIHYHCHNENILCGILIGCSKGSRWTRCNAGTWGENEPMPPSLYPLWTHSQQVGYCIRFDSCCDPKSTRIKVNIRYPILCVITGVFSIVSHRWYVSEGNDEGSFAQWL